MKRWWLDQDEQPDDEPVTPPAPAVSHRPDGERLVEYRRQLRTKALLLPRQSSRRRAVEKTLVRVTAAVLRAELAAQRTRS
jgi:hypothetical protein